MIDEESYSELLKNCQEMLKGATGPERAFSCLMVAILSELRTTRSATLELQKQFDRVSASGNVLATERVR